MYFLLTWYQQKCFLRCQTGWDGCALLLPAIQSPITDLSNSFCFCFRVLIREIETGPWYKYLDCHLKICSFFLVIVIYSEKKIKEDTGLSRNCTRQLTSNILCPPSSQIWLKPVDDWREFWQIPSHLTWKISAAAAQNSSANQANPDCCCRVHCKCLQVNYFH